MLRISPFDGWFFGVAPERRKIRSRFDLVGVSGCLSAPLVFQVVYCQRFVRLLLSEMRCRCPVDSGPNWEIDAASASTLFKVGDEKLKFSEKLSLRH